MPYAYLNTLLSELHAIDAVAIRTREVEITYKELYVESIKVAHYLINEKRIVPGSVILVAIDHSPYLVISIVSILLCGAIYCPFYPLDPVSKLQKLRDSTNSSIILSLSTYSQLISIPEICYVDDLLKMSSPKTLLTPYQYNSNDILYIMATSGTTGIPKLVQISVGSLDTYTESLYELGWRDHVYLQFSKCSFDVHIREIFCTLYVRGTIAMFYSFDLIEIGVTIEVAKVHTITCVPSFLSLLQPQNRDWSSVKRIVVSGEQLRKHHIECIYRLFGTFVDVYNLYGPAECTIDCLAYKVPFKFDKEYVPIGVPLSSSKAVILNPRLRPVGFDMVGDLYIGGPQIMVSYLGNPIGTSDVIINHPQFGRLYKTGDLALLQRDKNIVYKGRSDYQVKIRGQRVELEEIETIIRQEYNVVECIVIKTSSANSEEKLIAFLQVNNTSSMISSTMLQDRLKTKLSQWMIPSWAVLLPLFPLTTNGKINRNELIAIFDTLLSSTQVNNHANDSIDPELNLFVSHYQQICPSVTDQNTSVFDAAVASIDLINLAYYLHTIYKISFTMEYLMVYSSPKEAWAHRDTISSDHTTAIQPLYLTESPASKNQDIMLLDCIKRPSIRYETDFCFTHPALTLEKARQFCKTLINRHSILRTSFKINEGSWYQIVHPLVDTLDIHIVDVPIVNYEDLLKYIRQLYTIDFVKDTCLYRLFWSSTYSLVWIIHHTLVDGYSCNLLVNELTMLCNQESLADIKLSYIDYSYMEDTLMLDIDFEWWKSYLQPLEDYLLSSISVINPLCSNVSTHTICISTILPRLKTYRMTCFQFCSAVISLFLSHWFNSPYIAIMQSLFNRTNQTQQICGLFSNTLPQLYNLESAANYSIREWFQQVSHQHIQLQQKGNISLSYLLKIQPLLASLSHHIYLGQTEHYSSPEFDTPLFLLAFNIQPVLNSISIMFDKSWLQDTNQQEMINRLTFMFSHIQEGIPLCQYNFMTDAMFASSLHSLPVNQEYQSLAGIFFDRVKEHPQHIAVVHSNKSLTFYELMLQSVRLATYIKNTYHIIEGSIAVQIVHKSIDMIIGILALILLRITYLPIHPLDPPQRVLSILSEIKPSLILTQSAIEVPIVETTIIYLDLIYDTIECLNEPVDLDPYTNCSHDDIAYIIPTSGTTGHSKFPQTTRSNYYYHYYHYKTNNWFKNHIILLFSRCTFDVHIREILTTLLCGSTLVICEHHEIPSTILSQSVTVLNVVPSFLQTLQAWNVHLKQSHVQMIYLGGEPVLPYHLHLIRQLFPPFVTVRNIYGPAEAFEVTWWNCDIYSNDPIIPIGRPFPYVSLHILDYSQREMGPYTVGEIYIGGKGLMKDYLIAPTVKYPYFVYHPSLGKLYKTGDLGYYDSSHCFYYSKRVDHQIKLRGQRIETKEIEYYIHTLSGVHEVVVFKKIIHEQEHLIAAILLDESTPYGSINYIAALRTTLPLSYLPSGFIELRSWPLTPNGKIDRTILLEMDIKLAQHDIWVPETTSEHILHKLLQTLFSTEHLILSRNIVDWNWTSIQQLQLMFAIQERGIDIDMEMLSNLKKIDDLLFFF